jgi:hypothetical protein
VERGRGARGKGRGRTGGCGALRRAEYPGVAVPLDEAETRIISGSGGLDRLVTVVARLASEGAGRKGGDARIVVRVECLTHPYRAARVATLRATTLRTVDERRLRTIVRRPARRSRYPALARRPRGARGVGESREQEAESSELPRG